RWYADDPSWRRLRNKRWNIDGVKYEQTLGELAEEAAEVMPPSKLCQLPMVTAHGDDHQGNVWVKTSTDNAKYLTLFDPAFASENIPALLAFAKSTYHNAIAHPYWLYHHSEDEAGQVIEDDNWVFVEGVTQLSPMRQAILDSAVEQVWLPLLREMAFAA